MLRVARTVAVGDTENDVRAAHAVPIPVVGILSPYGGNDRLRSSSPDILIESLDQLPEALKRLIAEVA